MAKNTGALKHTHKYFRRADGRWACAGKDGCTHFLPKNMEPLPAGMMSDCWGPCEKEFRLAPYNMIDGYPKCDNCLEMLSIIDRVESAKGPERPKTGLEAFGARPGTNETLRKSYSDPERLLRIAERNKAEKEKEKVEVPEEDKIEVFNPDEARMSHLGRRLQDVAPE